MPSQTDPSADEAGHDAWMKAAARSLKGAAIESLAIRTVDGVQIRPLYDAAPVSERLRSAVGWDVRASVRSASPEAANALAHEALGGGATSLLIEIDETGPIGSAADMARALEGVVLEAAPAALDAGLLAPLAAEWLGEAAKGSPAAPLAFHLDPLGAFAEAGECPGPVEAHLRRAAETATALAGIYPQASLFLASGRAAHEAGGSPAQELGMMAAAAVAYVRALSAAGMAPPAALGRIVLGLAVDEQVLVSVAKLRAARRIWARIAAAWASASPARIEARSSGRMLTAVDPWTNLLRLTVAGFSGAVGGADALVLGTFTDALGLPTERARRLARNTQLILAEEAHLGGAADATAGAWAIESLTDQLARQGWMFFQTIERQNGLLANLTSGRLAAEVAAVRAAREMAVAEGALPILGVTHFPDPQPLPVEVEPPPGPGRPRSADIRLPGPDSRCPPLSPHRVSARAEPIVQDLET
jgi:methylmalonyl-CoA mutase